jgi:uncharacterized membrane protein
MRLFERRRERPPVHVVAMLPGGERVVSWADTDSGSVVVATPTGLWWPAADGLRRIGWERIDRAVWRDGYLTLTEADVVDDLLLVDRPEISIRLAVPRDLPPTVRKRVEANIVRSEVHPVSGGSARFVARRIPGRDGLVWWARLEPGVRADARVRAQVEDRVAAFRAASEADQPR